MKRVNDYEKDFNDVLDGVQEDLYAHHVAIYRQVEDNVIEAYKEIQRIQSEVIMQIARKIPGNL